MKYQKYKEQRKARSEMYKVYVLKRRRKGSTVVQDTKTYTPCIEAAKAAFLALRRGERFNGENYILLMTYKGEKLKVHRFDVEVENEAYYPLEQEVA